MHIYQTTKLHVSSFTIL